MDTHQTSTMHEIYISSLGAASTKRWRTQCARSQSVISGQRFTATMMPGMAEREREGVRRAQLHAGTRSSEKTGIFTHFSPSAVLWVNADNAVYTWLFVCVFLIHDINSLVFCMFKELCCLCCRWCGIALILLFKECAMFVAAFVG